MRPPRVYAAPKTAAVRGNRREVRVLTEAQGPFEQGEPWAGHLGGGPAGRSPTRPHEASGVMTASAIWSSSPRARPQRTCPARHGTRRARHEDYGGQDDLTEALVTLCPVERRHGLPEAVDRPTIVTLGLVGSAEIEVRQGVQDDIPPAVASARARWAAAIAWSYTPEVEKD